jgi:hypothetical protein
VLAKSDTSISILWLGLMLTPGLGPTRARRLVELLGSIEAVFRATLTELEAAGIPAASAQSLGTGKSLELAKEELAKACDAGVQVVAFGDPLYPARLKQIYDPPMALYVRGEAACLSAPGIARGAHDTPPLMAWESPSGYPPTSHVAAWLSSADWPAVLTRPAIADASPQKAERSRFSAPGSM